MDLRDVAISPGEMKAQDEIAAPVIDGFPLYDPGGARLGSIRHLVVTKDDGRIVIAVVTLGGLFPIGERYYPVPWRLLAYDEGLEGYVADVSRKQLQRAPSHERREEPLYSRSYCDLVFGHYGIAPEDAV